MQEYVPQATGTTIEILAQRVSELTIEVINIREQLRSQQMTFGVNHIFIEKFGLTSKEEKTLFCLLRRAPGSAGNDLLLEELFMMHAPGLRRIPFLGKVT